MSSATNVQSSANLELHDEEDPLRPYFDPTDHGLDNSFRLTHFVELEAGGLGTLWQPETVVQDELPSAAPKLGIPHDCSVIPLRRGFGWLVQTTGLCYPIIDDPYVMGKIACTKVLNNLYAMGVSECENLTILLGVRSGWTEQERDVVLPLMVRGYKRCVAEAGARITGIRSIVNPWCILGGVATSVCQQDGFIEQGNAIAGDVLLLTKPLGTQLALDAYQSIWDAESRSKRIKLTITEEQVKQAHRQAINSMSRLNSVAARLMFKHNAHGATHIGELGLVGHAQHLANMQKQELTFYIYNLPLIGHMAALAKDNGEANDRQLLEGLAPELSGGLLICLPRKQAAAFCTEIKELDGHPAWIIGMVTKGNRTVRLVKRAQHIDVKDD
ncbi:blast:Selenide%2C water dikinase [Drosophila guanche]|uniref:Blast:Selenide, water dikinase n=1 Tax=Drosophila guanche TaxID=7266 RepID=A0A3B0JPG6_DROGU|nr:blast:Selenide%2C water dikinase [Drosophila guanche]